MIIVLMTLATVLAMCAGFVLLLTFGSAFLWRHPELREAAEARPWDQS
jgi:hypothetical protein